MWAFQFEKLKKFWILQKYIACKDLSRVKADFKRVPLQLYFEFPATFQHWLTQGFQNDIGEQRF